MKLAIVSDVHANLIAFDAVTAAVQEESPELVVHGGDLVLNGPRPAEVVDRVRELGWPGIVGNTDEVLWGGMSKVPNPVSTSSVLPTIPGHPSSRTLSTTSAGRGPLRTRSPP